MTYVVEPHLDQLHLSATVKSRQWLQHRVVGQGEEHATRASIVPRNISRSAPIPVGTSSSYCFDGTGFTPLSRGTSIAFPELQCASRKLTVKQLSSDSSVSTRAIARRHDKRNNSSSGLGIKSSDLTRVSKSILHG